MDLVEKLLPRHLQIIYEINQRHLDVSAVGRPRRSLRRGERGWHTRCHRDSGDAQTGDAGCVAKVVLVAISGGWWVGKPFPPVYRHPTVRGCFKGFLHCSRDLPAGICFAP